MKWSVAESIVHSGFFSLDWLKENDYSNADTSDDKKPLATVSSRGHFNYWGDDLEDAPTELKLNIMMLLRRYALFSWKADQAQVPT